jgi:hypothetical protein
MNKRSLIPVLLLFLTALFSCKKVIQIDLNSAAPQIVIEGEITDTTGPYFITLSKTVNFSASNDFPPVSGATVQITDSNTAQTFTLTESSPGNYSTAALRGKSLHTYLLSVTAEGKSYKASSTMPAVVPLDSVTFVANLDFNNKNAINAVVNFQDPPGVANDYRFIETLNGKVLPDIFVFEDRLSDGRDIRQTLYNDTSTLHTGDQLTVDMYCVDKKIYDYFFSLLQVTGNNGFQSASPANPNTNISNGALGYFSAHTIRSKTLQVY